MSLIKKSAAKFVLFILLFFPVSASAYTETASAWQSWSGYWWPYIYGGLATGIDYKGQPAPLQKYEMLYNATYNGPTITEYTAQHYDPNASSWSGLCHAYAAAAATENLDFSPCVVDNILFRTGDKKGLISMSHDNDWIMGIRQGCETPDILHFWLLSNIRDQGKAIVADLDHSYEVWNYPIYKYKMQITPTSGGVNVQCTIWYANDLVSPDYTGTDERTSYYEYTLFMSGDEITGGEWTGNSVLNHPDLLVMPLSPQSTLPSLNYDKVKSIASKVDDELESDFPVEMTPGTYKLLLLNEDQYVVNLKDGESAKISLKKEEGSLDITYEIKSVQGSIIGSDSLSGEVKNITLNSDGAPYVVTLRQNDYSSFGLYELKFDKFKAFEFANPHIHKGTYWGGVAIVNSGTDTVDDVIVTGYKDNGDPLQTYLGPFSLNPGEKKTVLMSDFTQRNVDRQDFTGLKVASPAKLDVAYMAGNANRNFLSFQDSSSSGILVLPDTRLGFTPIKNINWGLYNPGSGSSGISIKLFKSTGSLNSTSNLSLSPKEMKNYAEGVNMPYSTSVEGGWALIEADAPVSGYIQWMDSGGVKAEMLQLVKPGNNFVIPHAVSDGFWKTKVTLINVLSVPVNTDVSIINGGTTETTTVQLAPYEKKNIDIRSLFSASDDIFSSSIISIRADGNIAGYFTYDTPYDYISYPLLDESASRTELILPHSASDNDWWTGITLCNMNDSESNVQIYGFGSNGENIGSLNSFCSVPGHGKKILTVSEIFGTNQEAVKYIKIISDKNIYGLFGIANNTVTRIAGGVLE
ncbi:hypothetical protein [Desulforegula conservatrix]|uniref:hypothetical protein n=1 Tax=Desulforegula conservatrix TaxID=153026 RepID=UPI00041E6282|nr:hypothetical protein [Desulforegula conservatrix]